MWHAGEDQFEDAERMIRAALAIQQRRLPAGDPVTARTMAALGQVLEKRGRQNEAIDVLTPAIAILSKNAADATDLSGSLTLLAIAHYNLGHDDVANSLNLRVLDLDKQIHGARHPDIADDLINLGNIQFDLQHFAEAENYFRQARDITQSWYGKAHPSTADNANYLAKALIAEGKLSEAETLLKDSLTTLTAVGSDAPRVSVAMALSQLGAIAQRRSNWPEADADFKKSAQIYETVYGLDHSSTIDALASLAEVYLDEKRYAQAERELRDVIARFGRSPSADSLRVGAAHVALGETLGFERRYKDAEVELLAGYDMILKQAGPSDERVQAARSDLVAVYDALHEPEKAVKLRAEYAANAGKTGGITK
jgi:serine/threonine-protein kinase